MKLTTIFELPFFKNDNKSFVKDIVEDDDYMMTFFYPQTSSLPAHYILAKYPYFQKRNFNKLNGLVETVNAVYNWLFHGNYASYMNDIYDIMMNYPEYRSLKGCLFVHKRFHNNSKNIVYAKVGQYISQLQLCLLHKTPFIFSKIDSPSRIPFKRQKVRVYLCIGYCFLSRTFIVLYKGVEKCIPMMDVLDKHTSFNFWVVRKSNKNKAGCWKISQWNTK